MTIKLNNVTVAYDRHPAIHHISCEFEPGSMIAMVGPNGAGKSTLLKAIAGFVNINDGEVSKGDLKPTEIAYLPQQSEIKKNFPSPVLEFVLFAYWQKLGIFKKIGDSHIKKAKAALETVGLAGFEERVLGTLSVGQLQRVLFARTMLEEAKVILLDEPFNAIDSKTTEELLSVVHKWNKEKRTVIAVLHDVNLVKENFEQTLLIARECIAFGPTKEVLSKTNLMRARKMMEAWDEEAEICNI